MEPKMIELERFQIIGIATETTNEYEMKGNVNIPALWKWYLIENVGEQIPHHADANTVAVYTDYESDDTGSYTLAVGRKVNCIKQIPDSMVTKEVPSGKYLVFTSRRGSLEKVVVETWLYIWNWFTHSKLKRAYKADFELYDERSVDPHNAQIEIYIGIKYETGKTR